MPDVLTLLRGLARGLHMAAACSLFGTCLMAGFLLPAQRLRGMAWLAWGSFWVLLLAGLAWFLLQAANMSGAETLSDLTTALPVVAGQTRFGALVVGRSVAALLAILLFQWGARKLAVLAAWACVAGEAWLDHGGAMTGTIGNVLLVSAVIHLTCGGAWLGALPALRLALRALPLASAAGLARRFSPLGVICVAGMIVSAAVQYVYLVGGLAALFHSAYGLTAAFKILILALLVAIAARNRWHFTPALAAGFEAARARLLGSVTVEIALGLAALLAAGWLLQLTPPAMALMLNQTG